MPGEWHNAVEQLRTRLGDEVVGRWIAPLKLLSTTDDAVVLEAPNLFFRDWVTTHYASLLQESLSAKRLTINVASGPRQEAGSLREIISARAESSAPPAVAQVERPTRPGKAPETDGGLGGSALNPKFTFGRFVVGPSNRFAHAASLAVAESPAKAYNPLFIYGGVGLGKTHLMQAIGHAISQRSGGAKVCYVSSEQFTNELITAIQTRTTARFRERFRTAAALLIDDIHFIAGRESTQEEFFHTFNTLYDAHGQIVVSSDRSPKDIAGLEERLVSRFGWGLVTDIQPPDQETRIAILRKKAEEAEVAVPGEVTDFIAKQITANIRELEGALIRVVAYAKFFSKPLSVVIAQEVLKDMVVEVGARLTLESIQERVGEYFQLSARELRAASRQRSVLYPRQVAMYLCRKLTDSSLPEIGRAFGGKNHTTVMHAIEKIEQEIAQDLNKKRLIEQLERTVSARR